MRTQISQDLFLEVAEFGRFEKGLRDDGFALNTQMGTKNWGIIRNSTVDPNFDFFRIVASGDINKFRIKEGIAFDKDRLCVNYHYPNDDITLPAQGTNYWVKMSHIYESREAGTVSIGGTNKGVLNGVGTEFTKILRGQPNFPSKIKFLNSTIYPLEYEVLEVIDDNNVSINGVFDVFEANLQFAVVGTFTPGFQPAAQNKQIFQYDSCKIDLIEDTTGDLPTLIDGKEFIIGKVSYTSSGIAIQDYRFTCFYSSVDRDLIDSITEETNKLVGIESVKRYGVNGRNFYTVGIDWKFNITSEIQNNGVNTVAVTSGYGGAYKSPAQFVDGECDGWRYYYDDGNYSTVLASIKQGTNTILLFLDSVRIGSGPGVCITPNAEEIEIDVLVLDSAQSKVFNKTLFFGIAQREPSFMLGQDEVLFSGQRVRLMFNFKNHFRRTKQIQFNQSTYYNENAFDSSGNLVNQNSTTTDADVVLSNALTLSNSFVPLRVAMSWFPESQAQIGQMFDSNGIGKPGTQFLGWIILNGYSNQPDGRGRTMVGAINVNQIPGPAPTNPAVNPATAGNTNFSIDGNGGTQRETLTEAQMPVHGHDSQVNVSVQPHNHGIAIQQSGNGGGGSDAAWNRQFGPQNTVNTNNADVDVSVDVTIGQAGGGQSHNNLQPYLVCVWVMRLF